MKMLFLEIATERNWALAAIGPSCLASWLRQHGHDIQVHVVDYDATIDEVIDAVRASGPALIGLSMTTRQWLRGAQIVAGVRAVIDIPVIAGGLHPTFSPEGVLDSDGFDYVCLGEGEGALLDVVEHIEAGVPIVAGAILNIQCRGAKRPELRPPVPNLDDLPWMARDMLMERPGMAYMVTQRGCPFLCTYCAARMYNEMYSGYGRRRSLENVHAEIAALKERGVGYLLFLDDTFTIHRGWVKDFCEQHAANGAMPFSLHARAETMTDAMMSQLASAGCKHITYGVESGSERVRREIMRRHISNDKLIDVFERTKAAGILVTANYILGTPGEKPHEIQETLDLHEQLMPNDFGYFVFYPYPGTPLFKTCMDANLLPDDWMTRPANHRKSILNLPDLTEEQIDYYYDQFTRARERGYISQHAQCIDDQGKSTVKARFQEIADTG
jgi:anaerobic magnesium-protoporphyrin IX monomethyl ester cyclase